MRALGHSPHFRGRPPSGWSRRTLLIPVRGRLTLPMSRLALMPMSGRRRTHDRRSRAREGRADVVLDWRRGGGGCHLAPPAMEESARERATTSLSDATGAPARRVLAVRPDAKGPRSRLGDEGRPNPTPLRPRRASPCSGSAQDPMGTSRTMARPARLRGCRTGRPPQGRRAPARRVEPYSKRSKRLMRPGPRPGPAPRAGMASVPLQIQLGGATHPALGSAAGWSCRELGMTLRDSWR